MHVLFQTPPTSASSCWALDCQLKQRLSPIEACSCVHEGMYIWHHKTCNPVLFQWDITHSLCRVHTDCKQENIPLKGLNQGVLVSLSWDVIGCFLSMKPIILLQSALVQVIMHYTQLVLYMAEKCCCGQQPRLKVVLLVAAGNIQWKQDWCGEQLKEFERERACYETSIHYSLVFCLWISGNLGCESYSCAAGLLVKQADRCIGR